MPRTANPGAEPKDPYDVDETNNTSADTDKSKAARHGGTMAGDTRTIAGKDGGKRSKCSHSANSSGMMQMAVPPLAVDRQPLVSI